MRGKPFLLAAALVALVADHSVAGESAQRTPDVTFVAWNVRNYRLKPSADGDGRVKTPAKDEKSMQAVAGTLAKLRPDIVGLCEIGSPDDLEDLRQRLKKLGVDLPHRAWVEAADRERHLALLSRFPVSDEKHDTASSFRLGGLPRSVQRGFLDCNVRISPEFVLRVLGAHFKSRRVVPEFDHAEFRRNESLLLRSKVDDILRGDPGAHLLLFGDLNDNKNSPAVSGLTAGRGPAGLEILELADGEGDQWTYLWPETDEYSRVDYVMVSKALLPFVIKNNSFIHRSPRWTEASDHRPLVVKLALPVPLHDK